jgi:hypothetical protein
MATTYKGVKILTAALVAGAAGVVLWFERSGPAWVHTVDFAEVAAQTIECTGELAGDGSTNVLWRIPIWEPDWSVTNSWGGYASVTVVDDGPSWLGEGTYVFAGRLYGSAALLTGGAFDVYTNASDRDWALIDCGPAGASWTRAYSDGYKGPMGWVFNRNTISYKFTAAWYPITNGIMWETTRYTPLYRFIHNNNGIIQTNSAFPNYYKVWPWTLTFGTTCPARVRYYSPRRLTMHTNAIGATIDEAMITGIRAGVLALGSDGTPPCFIGPTNAAGDYDGVADFPKVSTSAWWGAYYTWSTNKYATTNGYYSTNGLPPGTTNWITVTNWQPNAGIVATTNEQAWLYAVLHRLRDSRHDGAVGSGYLWQGQAAGATLDDAYATLQSNFPDNPIVAGPAPMPPQNTIRAYTNSGQITVFAVIVTNVYRVSGLWTGAVKTAEWMMRCNGGVGYTDANGGPPTSNLWHLFDTQSNVGTQTVSAVIGDFALPPKPPTEDGTTYGWVLSDCDVILRWTQPACTQAVFEARFP